ncbi:MAG TPA: DUF4097 family beta strand repeat-containing protein [Bacteroidota bacterium]|nr:DUF4097 family beta strand repeat-containing protein [Bacteroidota bacterium]
MRDYPRFALVSALALIWVALSFGQESREVRKTVPLNADGRVLIDTYKGSITVTTWDKAEVDIYATIEADEEFMSRRSGEEKVRDTEIRIDNTAREVSIKSDYGHLKRHLSFWDMFDGETGTLPYVHYTIKMPKTASLKIKDYKSETNIADLKSDLDLNTYKGKVKATGIEGTVDIETYKGEIRVEYASLGKSHRYETYKGEIVIVVPRNRGFDLDADVGSKGDLRSDFVFQGHTKRRRDKTQEYRTSVNGGGPILRLETTKGTYRLRES